MKRRTITSKLLVDFEALLYSDEKSTDTIEKYISKDTVHSFLTNRA